MFRVFSCSFPRPHRRVLWPAAFATSWKRNAQRRRIAQANLIQLRYAEDAMTPSKLVASLPSSIRVGPYDVGIVIRSSEQQRELEDHGLFSGRWLQIEIEPDATSCAFMADTFLHEVTHAIYYVWGIRDEDDEERTVSTLTTGKIQVYRDNPWLLDWLKKALK